MDINRLGDGESLAPSSWLLNALDPSYGSGADTSIVGDLQDFYDTLNSGNLENAALQGRTLLTEFSQLQKNLINQDPNAQSDKNLLHDFKKYFLDPIMNVSVTTSTGIITFGEAIQSGPDSYEFTHFFQACHANSPQFRMQILYPLQNTNNALLYMMQSKVFPWMFETTSGGSASYVPYIDSSSFSMNLIRDLTNLNLQDLFSFFTNRDSKGFSDLLYKVQQLIENVQNSSDTKLSPQEYNTFMQIVAPIEDMMQLKVNGVSLQQALKEAHDDNSTDDFNKFAEALYNQSSSSSLIGYQMEELGAKINTLANWVQAFWS